MRILKIKINMINTIGGELAYQICRNKKNGLLFSCQNEIQKQNFQDCFEKGLENQENSCTKMNIPSDNVINKNS